VLKSFGMISSSQHRAVCIWPLVVMMMIFPSVLVFSTWVHHVVHRNNLQRVMSSLFLFFPTVSDIEALRVALSIPSMGMDAPFVKNLLLLVIMFQ